MIKQCVICGKEFACGKFHPHQKYCSKECANKHWRIINKEENKEKQRKKHRIWYLKNRKKRLKQTKEYAKKNPEVGRKASEKWKKNNPEKVKENYKKQNKKYWKKLKNNPEKLKKEYEKRRKKYQSSKEYKEKRRINYLKNKTLCKRCKKNKIVPSSRLCFECTNNWGIDRLLSFKEVEQCLKEGNYTVNNGYCLCYFSKNKKRYRLHRLVFINHYKRHIKRGMVINHIDHNTINNSIENLEEVTPSQNTQKSVDFYSSINT